MNGTVIAALAIIIGLSMLLIAVVAGVRIVAGHAEREGRYAK